MTTIPSIEDLDRGDGPVTGSDPWLPLAGQQWPEPVNTHDPWDGVDDGRSRGKDLPVTTIPSIEDLDREVVERARRIAVDIRTYLDGGSGDFDERGLLVLAQSRIIDLIEIMERR